MNLSYLRPPTPHPTMVQNNPENRLHYWATPLSVRSHHSLVRLLAHFAHSRACGTVNDWMAIYSVFFFLFWPRVELRKDDLWVKMCGEPKQARETESKPWVMLVRANQLKETTSRTNRKRVWKSVKEDGFQRSLTINSTTEHYVICDGSLRHVVRIKKKPTMSQTITVIDCYPYCEFMQTLKK